MTIRNIKASFILDEKVASPSELKNFVVKQNTFIITIYSHTQDLVNVTGIKSFAAPSPYKARCHFQVEGS